MAFRREGREMIHLKAFRIADRIVNMMTTICISCVVGRCPEWILSMND